MKALLQDYQDTAQASLAEALSLPFAVYHDQQVYQYEAQHLFRNEWVFVCASQQINQPGDYFAFDLVGEAIAIVHGKDGQFRALSNICRHRGTPLLDEGIGRIDRHLVCPYHAWAYDDHGQLKAAPFTGDIHINKTDHCLPHFQLDHWMGLLFIHLGQNPEPLSKRLQGIDPYLSVFEPQRFSQGYTGAVESWQCNWKLAMENAMESYHLFKVHEQTLETITPSKQAYYIAGSDRWSLTGGKMLDQRSKLMQWLTSGYPEAYNHYVLIALPPSFVGILSYESLDWIQVLPNGTEQCSIRSAGISTNSHGADNPGTQQFVEAFFAEDKWICERVQKGMHTQLSRGGKLAGMEKVLVDFRQFIVSRLFDSQPDPFSQSQEAQLFLDGSS